MIEKLLDSLASQPLSNARKRSVARKIVLSIGNYGRFQMDFIERNKNGISNLNINQDIDNIWDKIEETKLDIVENAKNRLLCSMISSVNLLDDQMAEYFYRWAREAGCDESVVTSAIVDELGFEIQ